MIYTSAIGSNNPNRRITVSTNEAIPGVNIKIAAAAANASGAGNKGIPINNGVILKTFGQNIITGIGGTYTGSGSTDGHQLTISLEASSYSQLEKTKKNITITYTILE